MMDVNMERTAWSDTQEIQEKIYTIRGVQVILDRDLALIKEAHDRFLIIDQKTMYHFGASLKDLGKKWFAFSQMELSTFDMLNHLPGRDVLTPARRR